MVPKIPLSPKLKNSNSIRETYLKISLEIVGATKLNETTYKKYLNRVSIYIVSKMTKLIPIKGK